MTVYQLIRQLVIHDPSMEVVIRSGEDYSSKSEVIESVGSVGSRVLLWRESKP
jgi:hypothetical protein